MKQNLQSFNRETDLMNLYVLYSSRFLDTENVKDVIFWGRKKQRRRKAGKDRCRFVNSGDRSQSASSMRHGNGEPKDTVNAKELTQKKKEGAKRQRRKEKKRRAMPLRLRLAKGEGRRHNGMPCGCCGGEYQRLEFTYTQELLSSCIPRSWRNHSYEDTSTTWGAG